MSKSGQIKKMISKGGVIPVTQLKTEDVLDCAGTIGYIILLKDGKHIKVEVKCISSRYLTDEEIRNG